MNWEKIENHLFNKYCVEGDDKELQRLMEEHDKEVQERSVEEFTKSLVNQLKEYGQESSKDYSYFGCKDDFGAMNAYNHCINIVKKMVEDIKEAEQEEIER